ncbi:YbjN domain-containing protein [Pararhodobacter sp.]|uniref:YbjN domain-containing protein n=1 Tax=Pararhodobacter sp. TaxID=2127056 RepID=UPI002FDFDB1E|nr:YbjN domain-containing protein [Pseudomonadota bacterium]
MISVRLFAVPALVALLGAGPVLAQQSLNGMITGNDVDRIAELARAYGTIERREDADGVWLRGEMDGIVYTISFLNCNDAHQECTSVQFRAWWESNGAHSMDRMNQWNRDRRFSAAYLDANNNATIEWDVNLAGGVTATNFDDSIQWWQAVVRQFREQVVDPGFEAAGMAPSAPSTSATPSAPPAARSK